MANSTPEQSKNKRLLINWQRQLRYFYLRVMRLRGTPEEIARGLAAGVFTGLFPIFGLQIIAGVLIAVIIRGNKIMAAAGTWISNPLTSLPLYIVNYHVGKWLMRYPSQSFSASDFDSWEKFTKLGTEFVIVVLVGSCFMGLICAIPSYFLGIWFIRRIRSKKRRLV